MRSALEERRTMFWRGKVDEEFSTIWNFTDLCFSVGGININPLRARTEY